MIDLLFILDINIKTFHYKKDDFSKVKDIKFSSFSKISMVKSWDIQGSVVLFIGYGLKEKIWKRPNEWFDQNNILKIYE